MGAAIAVAIATALSGTASARLSPTALATATASRGSPVTIGFAYPATGAGFDRRAAVRLGEVGRQELEQGQQAEDRTPARRHGARRPVDQSVVRRAGALGNGNVLAVSGRAWQPAGRRTASRKQAGLAPISGSETRVALTRSVAKPHTGPRETPPGYFFRTVPNDGQQAATAAAYIKHVLNVKKVEIIDDSEGYSTGLRDFISTAFAKEGVTVTKKDEITEPPCRPTSRRSSPGSRRARS